MLPTPEPIRECTDPGPCEWTEMLERAEAPVAVRGLIADWPLVAAGRAGPRQALAHLQQHARHAPIPTMIAPPSAHGRLACDDDLHGFNFRTERLLLPEALARLERQLDEADPETTYLGSATVETWFPGLAQTHPAPVTGKETLDSIWIGNHSVVSAHQDLPDNLTCVAVGHRRFTVFPPDQLANLYIGPLDFNPAGQAISLVDFAAPDMRRYPRFAEAMSHALTITLAPGDALFIPSMWWHHIEALDRFNVMLNYWWRDTPAYMDTPMNALMLAILAIRDLPDHERAVWQEMFRHYVFEAGPDTVDHIPAHARGVLGPMDSVTARRLRARLLERINR